MILGPLIRMVFSSEIPFSEILLQLQKSEQILHPQIDNIFYHQLKQRHKANLSNLHHVQRERRKVIWSLLHMVLTIQLMFKKKIKFVTIWMSSNFIVKRRKIIERFLRTNYVDVSHQLTSNVEQTYSNLIIKYQKT